MHKTTLALQLLLCVGSPWAIGIQYVGAAEGSAAVPDSAAPNAATSGEWRERLKRPSASAPGNSLFETKSWLPEPPPQRPIVRAPEPPRAPPFPYQFLGRLETEGKPRTVYLTKGNEVYSAMPGEVLEGTYRVVDVTAESMEVTYLPLNMKQQIAFASIVAPAARQTAGRAPSDTPSIVAPTSVSVPPPMSISPPTAQGVQGEVLPPIPTPRTTVQRQEGRPSAPPQQQQSQQQQQQQPQPQQQPQSQQPQQAAASPGGGAPAGSPVAPAPVSSLSPSPVVVSPPTLSAFGSSAPTQAPPSGAPQTAGAAPAAPAAAPSGSAPPSAPPAGRM
jgi:hypothetical protein